MTASTPTTGTTGRPTAPPRLSPRKARDLEALHAAITAATGPVPCQSSDNPLAWISDDPDEAAAAARACRSCPVLEECGSYLRDHKEPAGVWGGKTPSQRQRPKRTREANA